MVIMAKVRTNILTPIIREYWLNKQMYDDDNVLRTIVDIYYESKTSQIIIEFDNGDIHKGFIKDYFDFDIVDNIQPIAPNKSRLKNRKR
jgi:hypothetical protein